MARFASGKFTLKNPEKYSGRKTPTYRSSWEFAFMKFCDEHPSVSQWASEAFKIPYRNPLTGKHTVYVPDFFIAYTDRNGKPRAECIEVKPANQALREKIGRSNHNKASYILNQAKWEAAKHWCRQNRIYFRVVTENDIFHQGGNR
tara:strand:- start:146 stop:583 length:438 start_codon:yes stop_codon:yes gene_type:complete